MKKQPASKLIDFLAEEVKGRRRQSGLSQETLAEKTGLSMAQISEIERGIANPTVGTLEKIADYFQVSVAELLDADDVINNPAKLKSTITDSVERLSPKQLRMVLSLIRLAQK